MSDFDATLNGAQDAQTLDSYGQSTTGHSIKDSTSQVDSDSYSIAFFDHKHDNNPQQRTLTAQQLCSLLTSHAVRTTKDGPAFSPVRYCKGAKRGNAGIEAISLAVLDFDSGVTLDGLHALCEGYRAIIYSTYSHAPDADAFKYRVVFFLSREVPVADWPQFWCRLQHHFGGSADAAAKDPARLFYLPACPPEQKHHATTGVLDGVPLDPDTLPEVPHPSPSAPSLPTARLSDKSLNSPAGAERAYCLAALQGEVAKITNAADGSKHQRVRDSSIALSGLIHTGGITAEEIEDTLYAAIESRAADKKQARRTIRDGIKYGLARPRAIPSDRSSSGARRHNIACFVNQRALTLKSLAEGVTPPVCVVEEIALINRETVIKCLNDEQFGDGKLFALLYDRRAVFDHSEKNWYFWDQHHWRKDTTGLVKRLIAGQLAAQYLGHAAAVEKEAHAPANEEKQARQLKLADTLTKRAKALRTWKQVECALYFAESILGIDGTEWDRDPWLLGVKNGVVNLQTGILRSGQPEDFIRTSAPTEWQDLDARCPCFEKFIHEIFDNSNELVCFTQRLFGYGLTGLSVEHKLPILWGAGRNGKDTLLETLAHTLGQIAGPVSSDVLVGESPRAGSATPHLCDLRGRRLVWASETNEGQRLNAGQVKYITGGGRIKGRPMYGHTVEFEPTHLLLLMTNKKPHAPADDFALWNRLLLIPFNIRFIDNPQAKNERQRIPHLKEALRQEANGILAWMVRGCLNWQQQGLEEPETITEATGSYQREEDTLSQFLADCCEVGEEYKVPASALYQCYANWAGKSAMWRNAFGEKMAERFEKKRSGKGIYYQGIGLLSQSVQAVQPVQSQKQKELKEVAHEGEFSQKECTGRTAYTSAESSYAGAESPDRERGEL